jgi:hypothetical protein
MKWGVNKTASILTLCVFPSAAHAQHVPTWLVFAVISPVFIICLAIVLGLVAKSLRVGMIHIAIVAALVSIFVLVSNLFTNDYVIWAPLVALAAHAVVIVILIIGYGVKRSKGRNTDESS